MDTKQDCYRIWGNGIHEHSVIWLDAQQLADARMQGYECEQITGKLTKASLAIMRQSYGSAMSATSAGHDVRYHQIRPVTAEWGWYQYLTDSAVMESNKAIMLIEDAVSWITKRRGRVDTDASDTA